MQASPSHNLLVIGGSAGSLSMTLKIIPLLEEKMNVAVIVVFHRKSSEVNVLIELFSERTKYHVKEADEKDLISAGTIYIAPADYHVLIEKDFSISLDVSEKINYSRPSIDVTFESAAEVYKNRLVCLLLSGANADGVEGLLKAKQYGSIIAVQDPENAEVPFMPQEAVNKVKVDLLVSDINITKLFQGFNHTN